MIDFTAIVKAGVTQAEIAKVLGVSRVTVNLWINGKMRPHRYNQDNIRRGVDLLTRAASEGLIPKARPQFNRVDAIKKAMQQVADQSPAF